MKTHYSAIDTHRRCGQQYGYKYVEGLKDIRDGIPTPPLEIGSWWHAVKAAESLERGRARQTLRNVPRKLSTVDSGPTFHGESVTVSEVLTGLDEWWSKLNEEQKADYTEFCGEDVPTRIRGMFKAWQARWGADTEHEDPLGVEVYWEKKLADVNGEEFTLLGFIDEIVWDRKRKQVVVRDHKTAKTLKEPDTRGDRMQSQLQLYAWGINSMVKEWGYKPVGAVEYDRIRTSAPKSPKLNLDGTLSKGVKDYDLQTYLEWAKGEDGRGIPFKGRKKNGSEAGVYTAEDEVVERLSSPTAKADWNQRSRMPLNLRILETHLRSAIMTGESMKRTEARWEELGLAERDVRATCSWCPFQELCLFQAENGADAEYDPADFNLVRSTRKSA